jgi:hypothetical protein
MARRRRRFWKILLGILIVLFIGLIYAAWPGSSTFTVSPETTYVTEPLDKHGYVDYVTALNERLRGNIKPEDNANVLIWQALGPHPEGGTMPAEYFEWLGVPPPPEKGEYRISFQKYLREHVVDSERQSELIDRVSMAGKRPWSAEDEPVLAEWLAKNEKPLALIGEAVHRPAYFNPLTPARTEDWSPGLLASKLPTVQGCREFAATLVARAMLRTNEGKIHEACRDLLTCHRLGRVVGHGGTLIEMLVGYAIEAIALRADLVVLERACANSNQILAFSREMDRLPSIPSVAEEFNVTERFTLLDIMLQTARHGTSYLESLSRDTEKQQTGSDFEARLFTWSVNWDPALRTANTWCDRIVAALRIADRSAREDALAELFDELRDLKYQGSPKNYFDRSLLSATARGNRMGEIIIPLFVPAFQKVQGAADRSEQNHRNLQLAFTLAAYYADHRRYPETLAELAPKYIDKIPDDLFSGQPLIYRLEGDGYLLYSVGVNGIDDGGQGYDDDPKGDDLVIRMPVPEPKLKK